MTLSLKTRTPRDRDATRNASWRLSGRSWRKAAFSRRGINAIAARAKTDKVLIYRYFGGLDALLATYAEDTQCSTRDVRHKDCRPIHGNGDAANAGN